MRKLQLRERQFKRLSFASTLLGIVFIAVGLQRALVGQAWLAAAVLVVLGVAIAMSSVFMEVMPEPGFVITLYTREGCTLCDAAKAFLVGKKAEYDYDLWEVDVDNVPQNVGEKARPSGRAGLDADAKAARYSDFVPVAVVNGEELFRLAPDYVRLEARLRALADARLRR